MADYTYFMFDGVSSSKYNLYIQNNGEDLSYPSQPGFENQIVSPLYQGTNYLAGVNKKERTFSFNCWADSLNRDSVRAMLDWLSPDKVSELVLSYNPNYYYKAKLASVTDFKHMAINGDETSNYEFQLTFVTIGDFAAISRTDFVINTKANPVNANESLFLNPDNLAPTAIWDNTTSKFKLFNYASEPMYLTTKINGTTQFTIDKNDVAQYAYSKTAAADFVADSKYGFVKIGNNLAETYSDVTATTNLGAMSIESGRPETLYTTINGTPGATVTLNYTDHILENTDTTNLYMIIQDGDYGIELLTQEMTEAERQLYITESINEQYNKINRDGSNSEIINLSFLGGANLSYVSDRQILQYTNPDGTTNDIGGEVWFSEGKATEFIPNGSPVQFAGAQGDHYLFKIAVPSEVNANPTLFMGVATSDIARNAWGKVTHFGVVHDFNTNGWAQGTVLWFDSTNGGLTTTEPVAPKAKIQVAAVVRAHPTAGSILVRTNFMPRLSQDSDTLITNPQDGDTLVYSSTNGRWENNDILNSKADKLYATNLVTNGDFSNGTTGWSATYGTNTVANNTLTNTASGVTNQSLATYNYDFSDLNKFYIKAKVRVTNSNATVLRLTTLGYSSEIVSSINNPTINNWYEMSGIITSTASSNSIRIYQNYIDPATANGKVMEVQYVLAIDLTATFGVGNEPTATEMDTLLAKFPNSWFNGTNYLADLSEITKLGVDSIQNATEANAKIEASSTGAVITRNVNDANAVLKVNQQNASSTGKILDLQFGGTSVANVDKTGNIGGTALYVGLNGGIFGSMIAQGFNLGSTVNRPRIYRNVADALPAITIDQQNASSTGNIAEFQFNGTTKLAIDKNGLLPATNVTNTPSGNIVATTVQGAINELDTDKADKLNATNLVTNGDFSNGTTGWLPNASTISVANNLLSITGDGVAAQPFAYQNYTFVSGRKYYFRMRARVTNSLCSSIRMVTNTNDIIAEMANPVSNTWYSISNTGTSASNTSFRLRHIYSDNATANGKVMEVQYVLVIDLTATFGVGNEPSKEQVDNMLSTFTNSWFNGTAELVSIANLAQLKADKTQEAWIAATLLAGATGNALYRKTQIGQLEIVIDITVGTATAGTTVFALPTAYKITKSTFAYLRNETTTGIVGFLFNFNGNCIILSGISTGQRMTGLITVPFYNS